MGGAKLDWERLKVFQTVADTGSINAAAKALSRSYTKVSSDLDELERALGHQLFERSHRGLELTAVGEDILRSARSMADSVQAIVERASEKISDRLVICTREGIATYWLARRLPELLSLQPDARVFLKVLPTTSPSSSRSQPPQTSSRASWAGCTTFSTRRPATLRSTVNRTPCRIFTRISACGCPAPSINPKAGGRPPQRGALSCQTRSGPTLAPC